MEEENALNGPTKQAPWITFNGVNHGDSQVRGPSRFEFYLGIQFVQFGQRIKNESDFLLSVTQTVENRPNFSTNNLCFGH